MSYESDKLQEYNMPSKQDVKKVLLLALFNNGGIIKEFNSDQRIVDQLAFELNLNDDQKNAYLETIYKKENRVKRSLLWHRLLFRAADSLAQEKLITRPTHTYLLTQKKEWMLTEKGINAVLKGKNIPISQKEFLPTRTYEVESVIKSIKELPAPSSDYDPVSELKHRKKAVTREAKIRDRGFRFAVIEAYEKKCAVCRLKIQSPNALMWEIEAAHIVPHSVRGKDDIWNGIALCRLHHWAFDAGWFSINDNYCVIISDQIKNLPSDCGLIGETNILKDYNNAEILLPKAERYYPHKNSITWHRKNILFKVEEI